LAKGNLVWSIGHIAFSKNIRNRSRTIKLYGVALQPHVERYKVVKMWKYAIKRWHFYMKNCLQRRLARRLLFERETVINYRPIGGFGTNASFEVIFQNKNILAFSFLKAIYHKK
jgi:hypothetical protein